MHGRRAHACNPCLTTCVLLKPTRCLACGISKAGYMGVLGDAKSKLVVQAKVSGGQRRGGAPNQNTKAGGGNGIVFGKEIAADKIAWEEKT